MNIICIHKLKFKLISNLLLSLLTTWQRRKAFFVSCRMLMATSCDKNVSPPKFSTVGPAFVTVPIFAWMSRFRSWMLRTEKCHHTVKTIFYGRETFTYWAIQQSWFARVNALCNLSRKKSREVAAHFRADL